MTEYTAEQIKENRRKWVEALRSGKYSQGRGWLRGDDGFCCLGVLAKVAGCRFRRNDGSWSTERNDQFAPEKAMKFVGLRESSGALSGGYGSLSILNDDGSSFADIAAIIESEADGLFLPLPA